MRKCEDRTFQVLHVLPGSEIRGLELIDAGIRMQTIKKTDGKAGIVHYGTEVITDEAHSISALLGASPGASVSVNIVLEVVKKCFPHLLATPEGQARMSEMIPTWNFDPAHPENAGRFREIQQKTDLSSATRRFLIFPGSG